MKKMCTVSFFLVIFVLPFSAVCFAENPIITNAYTADPAPLLCNGTVRL